MADQEPSTTRTPPPEESDKPAPKTEKEEEEANNNNGNNSTTTEDADRVKELEEENSVLRSMLSRANHRDPVYSTPQEKLQLQVEKLQAELKKERETRLRGQSLLAETRSQFEIIMLRKDQELKKTSDLYTKTANECESFRQRYRDAEALITVLKRDLTQCRDQLLKRTGSTAGSTDMSAPPDYRHQHGSGSAAPPVNRGGSATPSRHFSQLLRSISPAALQRNGHHSTHQEVIGSPAPKGALTPRAKSPSHQGTTTTSPTATTRGPRKPSTLEFKVGQRVLWNSHHGVIRFIGTVHCLDEGQYFGVELQHAGDGEHNGTLGGVKYFSAAPKGGVFCKMTEIVHAPKPVAKPAEEAASNKDNEPKKDEDNDAKATATEEKKDPAPARKPARKPASRAVSPAANGRKTEEKPPKKAAPASKAASKKPATKPAAKSSTPSKKKPQEEEKTKKEEEPQQQQQQSEEEQQKPQEQQTEPAPAEQTNEEEATATSEHQSTTAEQPAPTAAEQPKEEEQPQDEPSTDEPQAEQQTEPADETTAEAPNDERAPAEPSTETAQEQPTDEPAATTTAPAEADASAEKETQPQEQQEPQEKEKEEQTGETAATNNGEEKPSQAEDQSPSEEVVATNAEQKEDDQPPAAPEEEEKKTDEEGEKPQPAQQEGTAGQDDQA